MLDEKFYSIIDLTKSLFLFQFNRTPPFQTWSTGEAEEKLLLFMTDRLFRFKQIKMQIYCPFSLSKQDDLICVKTSNVMMEWGIVMRLYIYKKLNHKLKCFNTSCF